MIFTDIKATFTDGTALLYAVPSKKGGLILVKCEVKDGILIVSHECEFNLQFNHNVCQHTRIAEEIYSVWRWWERFKSVEFRHEKIQLQPDWEVIPHPASVEAVFVDFLNME